MDKQRSLDKQRTRRKFRVRKRTRGTAERPRLCINRTLRNISVQVIDDESGTTLAAASTQDKAVGGSLKYGGNADAATAIGKAIAEKALSVGVKSVCFDRGPYKYHGRVAALAEAARESGLEF